MFLAGLAGGVIATALLVATSKYWPNALLRGTMTYSELVTVILTGVAILITILGVFVATLAVWGFGNFEDLAKKAAKSHVRDQIKGGKLKSVVEESAREYLEREFSEDGSLRAMVHSRVDAILLTDADRRSGGVGAASEKIELNDDDDEHDE
jgi:hypothetical protein